MGLHPLDNPIWSSLSTRHRAISLGDGEVLRYPPDVAPFLGIAQPEVSRLSDALGVLVPGGDKTLLLGIAPVSVPSPWKAERLEMLLQMTCPQELPVPDGPDIVELGAAAQADVHALTALVYPHYFRQRTMTMGRYFGIYAGDRLAAMCGERLGMPGWREMSAICTHPDFLGRGYARRLVAFLGNDVLRRGQTPFLHVSRANARAAGLYEAMGYRTRGTLGLWMLERAD